MNTTAKKVTYQTTNSYLTLNSLSEKTKNIWVVLHGIGFLSRYFLTYFDEIPSRENYIIAPQAPSKYYLKGEYRHVGASWLTKEDTVQETKNVIAYLDSVLENEQIPKDRNLIVFGFSQGVSVATRWVAAKQLKCEHLILYAGGIPNELTTKDFAELLREKMQVTVLAGDQDEFLTGERSELESKKIENLFQGKAKQIVFKGGHEIKKELLKTLA